MAENSTISWTRHTWNPWMGCTKISPACDGCYAEALVDKRFGKAQWGNHPRVRTSTHTWNDPFRWQRQAEKDGDRPFVFCASLADIFDNQVDPQWRADAFEVMRQTPRLVYLLLTKRPQNIVKLSEAAGGLPRNAAIGATIEDQLRADLNEHALVNAAAVVIPLFTFVSIEPMVGGIRLKHLRPTEEQPRIDWVIAGGETDQGGHQARKPNPQWFRDLRDQCAKAGVPFHFKQWGNWAPLVKAREPDTMYRAVTKIAGRTLDGREHNDFPAVPAI